MMAIFKLLDESPSDPIPIKHKKRIIDLSPLGTINCHAGKLPWYQVSNVLNWVLINDENEFGITVDYMDEGIDTGDIT